MKWLRRFFAWYFTSWRAPLLTELVLLMMLSVPSFFPFFTGLLLSWLMTLIGLVGMILAVIVHFCRRRGKTGGAVFLTLIPTLFLFSFMTLDAFPQILFLGFFGPSKDHFADHLTLPPGIELAEPLEEGTAVPSADETKPDLILVNDIQGGLYKAEIRCNPGESGTIYLKAYEITKGTRLSPRRLTEASEERIGWSENPSELFLGLTEFTIYEGDWDQFYAARFEIWFRPDSGQPERKLLEKNFKIQGWMR